MICILWLNGYGICHRTEYFVLQLNTTPQAAGGQDADHPPTYPVARAVYRKGNDVLVNVKHPNSRRKSIHLYERKKPNQALSKFGVYFPALKVLDALLMHYISNMAC